MNPQLRTLIAEAQARRIQREAAAAAERHEAARADRLAQKARTLQALRDDFGADIDQVLPFQLRYLTQASQYYWFIDLDNARMAIRPEYQHGWCVSIWQADVLVQCRRFSASGATVEERRDQLLCILGDVQALIDGQPPAPATTAPDAETAPLAAA